MIGYWLQHFFGFNSGGGNSSHYLFWSGAGSDISELALLGALLGAWHHVNCHDPGCWRIARYPVAGGQFKVCARHHPDGKPRRHHIHAAHRAHQERIAAGKNAQDSPGRRRGPAGRPPGKDGP